MSDLQTDQIQTMLLSGLGRFPGSCLGLFSFSRVNQVRETLLACLKGEAMFGLPDHSGSRAMQIAFSAHGLRKLGLSVQAANGFDRGFCQGMTSEFRQRTLGDLRENAPTTWQWSDKETDIAVWVYAESMVAAEDKINALDDETDAGLKLIYSRPMESLPRNREHFGFRDGISNVRIPRPGNGDPDAMGAGDFIFGYRNALGGTPPGPTADDQPIGMNGSYLVLRQLEQDVCGFWSQWMEAADQDPKQAIWLASKAVGRWPNGMPVQEGDPTTMPDLDEKEVTEFDFKEDETGMKCPFGSHIRRANPRDGDPASGIPVHRIYRRGRVYGPVAPKEAFPDGLEIEPNSQGRSHNAERGIVFACLNTEIARQFEFVQQTWINNPKFRGLYDEIDPVAGGFAPGMQPSVFTIPAKPFRYRVCPAQSHVRVRGGGYFLMLGKDGLKTILG